MFFQFIDTLFLQIYNKAQVKRKDYQNMYGIRQGLSWTHIFPGPKSNGYSTMWKGQENVRSQADILNKRVRRPKIPDEKRQKIMNGWKRAGERSLDWEEH